MLTVIRLISRFRFSFLRLPTKRSTFSLRFPTLFCFSSRFVLQRHWSFSRKLPSLRKSSQSSRTCNVPEIWYSGQIQKVLIDQKFRFGSKKCSKISSANNGQMTSLDQQYACFQYSNHHWRQQTLDFNNQATQTTYILALESDIFDFSGRAIVLK